MGMKQLESAILVELREVLKDPYMRQKDIVEWSTATVNPHDGEEAAFLPRLRINVAYITRKKEG